MLRLALKSRPTKVAHENLSPFKPLLSIGLGASWMFRC